MQLVMGTSSSGHDFSGIEQIKVKLELIFFVYDLTPNSHSEYIIAGIERLKKVLTATG